MYHTLKRYFIIHKLPVGVQDFETLRTENYVYVDKTEQVYQMITQGRVYFLSRPRRFGKSLLVSTLHAIFRGEKHLFKDLWIDQSDYTWEQRLLFGWICQLLRTHPGKCFNNPSAVT